MVFVQTKGIIFSIDFALVLFLYFVLRAEGDVTTRPIDAASDMKCPVEIKRL